MSVTQLHSQADVLRSALLALGESWSVFVSREPDSPDEVVTLYDTQGLDDGRMMYDGEAVYHAGIQVRVRAATPNAAFVKAESVRKVLCESLYDRVVTLGATRYLVHCASRVSKPISIGKESPTSRRSVCTLNLMLSHRALT